LINISLYLEDKKATFSGFFYKLTEEILGLNSKHSK